MHEKFERALVTEGCLESVRAELRKATEADCTRILQKLERDYTTACLIKEGMRMPQMSPAYQVSSAFLDGFRQKYAKAEPEIDPVAVDLINFLREMEEEKGEQDHGTGK